MFENVAAGRALDAVQGHVFDHHDDEMGAEHIDAIRALDRVVRAAQAEQAHQIAQLNALRASQVTLGRGDHALSVIGELGMVRNISPSAAGTQYGFAVGLARLPGVAGVFAAGGISEQAARAVVNETSGLSAKQAAALDRKISVRLDGITVRKAANLARTYAIGIDADAAYERAKANRKNTHVSFFGDIDGVGHLNIRGPAEQLLSVRNTLDAIAATAKTTGDPRTRGQVMFDEFMARITGQTAPADVNVEVGILMTAGALMRTEDTPALLAGFGPIPTELAHNLIAAGKQTWIRRFFTDPVGGSITDCDKKRRRFGGTLKHLITTRDRRCRQPGCDCQIRQFDHILAHHRGGPTTRQNGQGLCVRSHTLKHLKDWRVTATDCGDILWQTPTGHKYTSTQPAILEYQPRHGPGHLRQ